MRQPQVRVMPQYGSLIGVDVDTRSKGKTSLGGGNPQLGHIHLRLMRTPAEAEEEDLPWRRLSSCSCSNFISVVTSSFGQCGRDDIMDAVTEYEQEREDGGRSSGSSGGRFATLVEQQVVAGGKAKESCFLARLGLFLIE